MQKSVIDEYSELMHYTSAAGLTGIISSQCIWSTHAAHLNDMEETSHFFQNRLPSIVQTLGEKHQSSGLLAQNPTNAKRLLDGFCHAIATATLNFNEPYIFSMCGAIDERTSQNGILSQWRAYGRDGGYAIVFDTQGIHALLDHENNCFRYQHLQWGDVYYHDPLLTNQKAQPEIIDAEKVLEDCIARFLTGEQEPAMEETYKAVTSLSSMYKHWGFQEEREVRIVAIPLNQRLRALTDPGQRMIKTPKSFIREGSPVPYIELTPPVNSSGKALLPIKRVIVGPHRNKDQRRKAVELMLSELGIDADVVTSEIPFTGC